jgi:hypothetical protein
VWELPCDGASQRVSKKYKKCYIIIGQPLMLRVTRLCDASICAKCYGALGNTNISNFATPLDQEGWQPNSACAPLFPICWPWHLVRIEYKYGCMWTPFAYSFELPRFLASLQFQTMTANIDTQFMREAIQEANAIFQDFSVSEDVCVESYKRWNARQAWSF